MEGMGKVCAYAMEKYWMRMKMLIYIDPFLSEQYEISAFRIILK